MSDPDELVIDLEETRIDTIVEAAVERALSILRAGAPPSSLEGKRQREALYAALKEDAAAIALLEASYREGAQDRARSIAASGAVSEADVRPPDPQWGDVLSEGEMHQRWREESICQRCVRSMICEVAQTSAMGNAFVTVSRCLGFEPPST